MNKIYLIVLGLSLSIIACKPSNQSGHGGHSHDEVSGGAVHVDHNNQTVSIFSNQTEVFAEFHPLVAGQVSTFLTHLTRLDTYRPYTEGKLSISLIKDGSGIRKTVEAPSSPGIFTPSLKPKSAGIYTLVIEVNSKFGKERFEAKNIEVYASEEKATKAVAAMQKENQTTFLKEQAWKIEFATAQVKNSPFQEVIKTTGTLLPAVNMEKQIVAKSNGIVHFESNDILAGKTIKKNSPIFILSGKELAGTSISTEFTKAKTGLAKAKSEFERAQTLHEDQIVSEKEYIKAKGNFENAEVRFNSINKNYNANGIKINSPVTGFISAVYVSEGQYVEKGAVLAKLDQGSKLLLKADVYQKHLKQLGNIKSANFRLPYRDQIFNTEDLNGRLIAYGKDIHEEDYTTPLYFELDIRPDLYAGSFVEIYLKSDRTNNVLHIAKSAVLEDQGLKYVFVQKSGESFEKRFVNIGSSNGLEVEITSGLKAGERVVSKGVYFVKLASMAGALPAHSHEH